MPGLTVTAYAIELTGIFLLSVEAIKPQNLVRLIAFLTVYAENLVPSDAKRRWLFPFSVFWASYGMFFMFSPIFVPYSETTYLLTGGAWLLLGLPIAHAGARMFGGLVAAVVADLLEKVLNGTPTGTSGILGFVAVSLAIGLKLAAHLLCE
jgi:hypothetical protein